MNFAYELIALLSRSNAEKVPLDTVISELEMQLDAMREQANKEEDNKG